MPRITSPDGISLHCEGAGSGTPILFIHKFGGNHESWEPQMPTSRGGTATSPTPRAAIRPRTCQVMSGHIPRPSRCGMRWRCWTRWASAARALSPTVTGAGYGCEEGHEDHFPNVSLEVARRFETDGEGASRVQFPNKDPRGWREFADRLAAHSDTGALPGQITRTD